LKEEPIKKRGAVRNKDIGRAFWMDPKPKPGTPTFGKDSQERDLISIFKKVIYPGGRTYEALLKEILGPSTFWG